MLLLLAAEVEPKNPILPDRPEIFWAAVSFFLLWTLMKYVLLPPVERGMAERAEALRADRDAADAAQSQAAGAANRLADQLAPAKAQAASVIDSARAEAEAERAEILKAASSEIEAMKSFTASELTAQRESAMAGIGPKVADLASQAAAKLLERPVAPGVAQPVVDRLLNPN